MKIRNDFNEYGTPISVHICEFCGREFEVCPAVKDENLDGWRGCLSPKCDSYDPERDVDKMLESGDIALFPKDRLN